MRRAFVPAFLLCAAVSLCIFLPFALSAQDAARVQTGPRVYPQEHHDRSIPLVDMIRYYPQPAPPTMPWVRPEYRIPSRSFAPDISDPVLQTFSPGPLAA